MISKEVNMLRFSNTTYTGRVSKYILMDESINPNMYSNATSGAVLLPPPIILLEYMDLLDQDIFYSKYHDYLYHNARDFAASIVYDSMFRNIDITIILDENYSLYFRGLMSFLYRRYGVMYDMDNDMSFMENNPFKLQNLYVDLVELGLVNPYECTKKLYPNAVSPF